MVIYREGRDIIILPSCYLWGFSNLYDRKKEKRSQSWGWGIFCLRMKVLECILFVGFPNAIYHRIMLASIDGGVLGYALIDIYL